MLNSGIRVISIPKLYLITLNIIRMEPIRRFGIKGPVPIKRLIVAFNVSILGLAL